MRRGCESVVECDMESDPATACLQESERQFRLLVAGVTDYALFMLDPAGIVTSWNVGAERIKGYKAGEIIGRHFSCFYTEADRAEGLPQRALTIVANAGSSKPRPGACVRTARAS